MFRKLILLAAIFEAGTAAGWAATGDPIGDLAAGRALAVQICAKCHNVQSRDAAAFSPTAAPTFYAVANAKTTTALGLNVFLQTPHVNMPNLILTADERRDVAAYILEFRERK